jgi:hypothetical protein
MSSIACTNCGAEITPGTKFCRRCGQPSLDAASVSEASTRLFEATAERAAPTETWNAQPTGPAYIAPGVASPLQDAAATRSLETTARRPQKSLLIAAFAVLFLAVVGAFALGLMLNSRHAAPTQTPPVVTRPGTDIPPPPPPPPAGQPTSSGPSVPTSELMYPGAKTVMDMKNGRDNLLELSTADQLDKVVDWYIARLKPTQIIRDGTSGAGAVLTTGGTQVIISSRGRGSDILIKQPAGK